MSTVKHFPVLLPKSADMSKWAVIACDQYTTDRNYWRALDEFVGNAPSTLRLIFPEIYLSEDMESRIAAINAAMRNYTENGIFREENGYVLTERTLPDGRKRVGLVTCVDLEEYDYVSPVGSIRPTEETIEERLPVRIHIRENAPLELPHILLLMDDAEKSVIEPVYANRNTLEKLYDFDLNMNGGHICGYSVPYELIPVSSFDKLLAPELQKKKYGKNAGILFAVGDGNHSMATAKKCWDSVKLSLSEEERENHPARYALVEVLNVYDDALDFLPIHRVVSGIDENEFIDGLSHALKGEGSLTVVTRNGEKRLSCPVEAERTIIAVQSYLEKLRSESGLNVEYVHEREQVDADVKNNGGVGIVMPYFPKNKLFDYVVNVGKLPKKAFSIGEEKTKKYYIEAKRIK